MEVSPIPSPRHAAHDLAKAAEFTLGPLSVDPPARRIGAGARSEMIEPKVMRVLVALGSAGGKVLSRDDLIELCWDGTIVGDNAIKRVIFQLRHALDDLSDGAVRLETIPRVGFRLVCERGAAEAASTAVPEPVADASANAQGPFWTRKMTRRAAAGVVAAGAGAALAYTALDSPAHHVPDPRALDLYQRGQMHLKAWELGSIRQAIAFNKQAVAIDPDYADGWGALAISYIHGLDSPSPEAKAAYPRLIRSAAERALALDPDQAEAHFALAITYPHYRRWLDHEQRLRPLVRRFPNYWYGHAQLGIVMADVGRYEEAVASYRRAREIDPMMPIAWGRLAYALQQAGHDQEADLVLDEALARWPEHVFLWITRYTNLLEGRRFAEAIAFSRDPARQPMKLSEEGRRNREDLAKALATGEEAEKMVELYPGAMKLDLSNASWAGYVAALGAIELAFDAIEAYYLGGTVAGMRYPPPGPLDKRPTGFGLLASSMLDQRDHPRFKALFERTGLEDYWRRSGKQPDFRKR